MSKRTEPREFLAGVLAAAVMTFAMVVLRLTSGLLSLPELLGEGIIRVMPAEVFSRLLDVLLRAAKPVLIVSIVLGQLAVGGLLGRIYGRKPSLSKALVIAGLTWLGVGAVLLPLFGLGFFGSAVRGGAIALAASLLLVFLLYALALVWFHQLLLPEAHGSASEAIVQTRRSALSKLGLGVAAVAIGGYGWRALTGTTLETRPTPTGTNPRAGEAAGAEPAASTSSATGSESVPAGASVRPEGARTPFTPAPGAPGSGIFAVQGLSPEVTPTKDFYTVSKNFFDPNVDATKWSLTIDGLVERPHTLDYESIQRLPAISDFYTLQCISNPVGGDLWGNAHWKGVRLADLLAQTGLKPGVRKVVFHAADDYTDSVVLSRALNAGAILAYEMNGEPLDKTHGYPARLLIPGIYGMKNVKWITRIELVDYDFKGYWMQRGWSDAAPYKTSSRIDVPIGRSSPKAGEVPIGGVAFAGDRGITAVEYSLDDGSSWQAAELKPALAANTWQLWVAWPELSQGRYTIKVRASDGTGELQTARETELLPDGASGYHTVVIGVA